MEQKILINAPDLKIDKALYAREGGKVPPNGKLERRIIWNLFSRLKAAGYMPALVDDTDEETTVKSAMEAMELIFNLDDCTVCFHRSAAERDCDRRTSKYDQPSFHWIRLDLGNGVDVISDYSMKASGAPGHFHDTVKGFDPEDFA